MNKGIQISGGSFAGGAFAVGEGAVANSNQSTFSPELEQLLLKLENIFAKQTISTEVSGSIKQANITLREQASCPTPDKSKIKDALESIGKAEPAIKGVGAIVGSIATLFGLLL